MVRNNEIVDAAARIYWPNGVELDEVETCDCPDLRMSRGQCVCKDCGTVYAASVRRAVKRWKTFVEWAV